MKRKTFVRYCGVLSVSLVIVAFTSVCTVLDMMLFSNEQSKETSSPINSESYTVIIDAGHGGEDGGAVGDFSVVLEKDINLAISKQIETLFKLTDIPVIMTRSEDVLLYNQGQENSKKSADIRNRIEIGNAQENNVFISIHQNKFPIEKYSGLQVYYSANNENSELLAQTIQANNALYIQPKNTRQIKKAGRNILLLHKLRCPAVLVECGFLSNANEEKLLSTSEHQNKLAFLIFSSVIQNLIDENI